jgi:hypothetical protein
MRVPFVTFLSFIGAPPTAKVACIRRFQAHTGEYDPRTDFYKKLREFIPRNHRNGGDASDLRAFVETVTSRKATMYRQRAEAYIDWWDGKRVKWSKAYALIWKSGALEVPISPELFVSVNEQPYVIKLYFPKERLSMDRASAMLRMLTLGSHAAGVSRRRAAILDLSQSRFLEATDDLDVLDPYLAGEAASFAAMVKAL